MNKIQAIKSDVNIEGLETVIKNWYTTNEAVLEIKNRNCNSFSKIGIPQTNACVSGTES